MYLLLGTKIIFKYNKDNLHKPFSFNNIALNTSKKFNIEIIGHILSQLSNKLYEDI